MSGHKVPFLALCQVLEAIQNKKTPKEKRMVLAKFISEWRDKRFEIDNAEDSFYTFLRCIVPQLEKMSYGIKEHSLGRLYIEVMGLGKKSDAANRLMNYKKPTTSSIVNKVVGDFAECAYEVVKDRCSVTAKLSVQHVVDRLTEIANGNLNNDRAAVRSSLEYLIRNLTGLENKWFIRMLLKDMKLGLGQDSILSLMHPDAPTLFSVDTNLERVCRTLRDVTKRLHEVEVSLFAPLKPMLGKQAQPTEVEDLLDSKPFYIETKYDGERMHLHMSDGKYKYFSRNGHEYTDTFGATKDEGNLTPLLHDLLRGVQNCILDGEMCGFDVQLQVLGSKAQNFDIKSATTQHYTPCYVAFDALYLNGEVLTNHPLQERLDRLAAVVVEKDGVLQLSRATIAHTNKDCIDALNCAIDQYQEGIMVKDPLSVYKPNSRTSGWFKIKPEYVDGLMTDLDIVIVGGYFGKGRRSSVLSHFICAVLEQQGESVLFHTMCKVGSGYTYEELLEFNVKLKEKWQRTKPDSVIASREKPDVWIDPLKSSIVQVKATEVIESSAFSTGFTLRFPRVERIRDDKEPLNCLSLAEFTDLRMRSSGKLTSGQIQADATPSPVKKRRAVTSHATAVSLAQQFRGADISDVKRESEALCNKEFCIVDGSDQYSKQDLERQVAKMGGSVVQNAGDATYAVVANKQTLKVSNYIKSGRFTVAKTSWLISCIEQTKLLDWLPSDLHAMSNSLKPVFDQQFDCFGDSYFTSLTAEKLKHVFSLMQPNQIKCNTSDLCIKDLEAELGTGQGYPRALFRNIRIYNASTNSPSSSLVFLTAQFYGATAAEVLDESVTHVIVNAASDAEKIQNVGSTGQRSNLHLVSAAWITDCVHQGTLLNETVYLPH